MKRDSCLREKERHGKASEPQLETVVNGQISRHAALAVQKRGSRKREPERRSMKPDFSQRDFWLGITSDLSVTQEKSRNSPELFSKLAWSGWLCRLPQFDRISLRVMQAGEPAVGIRLRVNLDLDSCGL